MDERCMAGWVVDGGGRDEWMGRMGGWYVSGGREAGIVRRRVDG